MAIEIKELYMQLHIGDQSQSEKSRVEKEVTSCDDCDDTGDKQALIEDTVKEVLRILKEQEER